MAEGNLYQKPLTVSAKVSPSDIQQAIAGYPSRPQRLELLIDNNGHVITDTWPADGNVTVAIGELTPEGRTVTVTATKALRIRTNRHNAPDVVTHAKDLFKVISERWSETLSKNDQDELNITQRWNHAHEQGELQSTYCDDHGIDVTTLRRWKDKWRARGYPVEWPGEK